MFNQEWKVLRSDVEFLRIPSWKEWPVDSRSRALTPAFICRAFSFMIIAISKEYLKELIWILCWQSACSGRDEDVELLREDRSWFSTVERQGHLGPSASSSTTSLTPFVRNLFILKQKTFDVIPMQWTVVRLMDSRNSKIYLHTLKTNEEILTILWQ